MVISPIAFNDATQLPVILPISTGGEFARCIAFAVPLGGTKITGVVRCDQPRVMDIHARGGKKVGSLPVEILDDALAKSCDSVPLTSSLLLEGRRFLRRQRGPSRLCPSGHLARCHQQKSGSHLV
ncbi:MAG TPA: type II toxin-antitoxin system PemK/MazF family toxin [Terracidiphilus sp.]